MISRSNVWIPWAMGPSGFTKKAESATLTMYNIYTITIHLYNV